MAPSFAQRNHFQNILMTRRHPGSFCRSLGDVSLRFEQGGTEAFAEDGNETETSGGVQYGTSRSEGRIADGG